MKVKNEPSSGYVPREEGMFCALIYQLKFDDGKMVDVDKCLSASKDGWAEFFVFASDEDLSEKQVEESFKIIGENELKRIGDLPNYSLVAKSVNGKITLH